MGYTPGGVMSVATARALKVEWPAVFEKVISIRQRSNPLRMVAYMEKWDRR